MPSHVRFWVVWCNYPPTHYRPSRKRHPCFDDAEREAQRLAKTYRGRRFQILEAVWSVVVGSEEKSRREIEALKKYRAAEAADLARAKAS
jgi:hypothetical protein